MLKIYYDLETTGLNPSKNSIHQIAGIVELDHVVVEEFNFYVRPNPKAQIDPSALAVGHVTEEQILAYPPMEEVYKQFVALLLKYINPSKKESRAWLVGYNNRAFDDRFLEAWFRQNGDSFLRSYFWTDTLDVIVLASQYLIPQRAKMPSFKLSRVATELGIPIAEDALHDAQYDVRLTREIYRIINGYDLL